MAIIAILLYMLIQVIAAFRKNLELQQASDQITIGISETKNSSNNNILPDSLIPASNEIYGYSLEVQSDRFVRSTCVRDVASTTWACGTVGPQVDLVNNALANIRLTSTGCDNILMINLTGDIKLGNSGVYSDTGICEIAISHGEDARVFRTFIFDSYKNSTEIKYAN
jgi:hypothetical protein